MRPLSIIVVGLAAIVVDFRTEALDLVPDALGWGLVALGAWRLSLALPAGLAAVAAAASLVDGWLPFRYVKIDPATGDPVPGIVADADYPVRLEYTDVSGWRLVVLALSIVCGAAALWVLLTRFAESAHTTGRDQTARQLGWLRWLLVAIWAGPYLGLVLYAVVYESGEFDPMWTGTSASYTWMAGTVVFALLGFLLVRERDRLWALPADSLRIPPWDARRFGDGASTSG